MTYIRAQCCWAVASTLPRDRVCINPCFNHTLGLVEGAPDWQTLADDLSSALNAWSSAPTSRQLDVKLYEIKTPVAGVPNRPKAVKTTAVGASAISTYPGEVALCLSFYGGVNAPHQRGRLYIPPYIPQVAGQGDRPSAGLKQKCADLVPIFAGLGGVNVDWIVYSPTKHTHTKITNWFVDDEWDTQRRRGLKATSRQAGTTSA